MPRQVEVGDKVYEFPDTAKDADITAFLSEKARADSVTAAQKTPPPGATTMKATSTPLTSRLGAQASHLPGLGGFLGGLMPGPWGVGLAGLGGGAGELARQSVMGEPADMGQVGIQGGKQAALGAAGLGLGSLGGMVARQAYRGALQPTAPLLERFPNVVEQMMKLGIPLKVGGREVAEKKLGEAIAKKDILKDTAELAGNTVPRAPIEAAIARMRAHAASGRLRVNEKLKAIDDEIDAFFRDNPNKAWTPNEADRLVMDLQAELGPIFAAQKKGTYVPDAAAKASLKLQQVIEKAVTKGLRTAVPGIRKAKADVAAGMAAREGATLAEKNIRKGVPARVPFIPTMVQALVPREARTIPMQSMLALGLNSPLVAALLGQVPRGLNEMLMTPPVEPDQQ